MACCAFAIFLLGQIYGGVAVVRRWLGLRDSGSELHRGAATWRPGAAAEEIATIASRPLTAKRIWLASFAGLAVGVAALGLSPAVEGKDMRAFLSEHAPWCGPTLIH